MTCTICGQANPAGNKFCGGCGSPLTAAPARGVPPPQKAVVSASPGPGPESVAAGQAAVKTPRQHHVSVWWIIIPTLVYAYLARDIATTAVLVVVGAALRFGQGRREVPASVRPLLPLVQPAAVYLFLGGSLIPVVVAAAIGFLVVSQSATLIPALEPWWQIQQQVPRFVRFVVGIVLTFGIGYYFGGRAGGREWTYTFISMATATAVMFLLMFDPPPMLRSRNARLPAGGGA